ALRLGAHEFHVLSSEADFEPLWRTYDLIVNTVSADGDLNPYFQRLRRDSTMVLVGLPEKPILIKAGSVVGGRRRLAGSPIGGIAETQEMLDFCATHNVVPDIELTSIDRVNECYERVIRSDVRYRFVI